MKTRSRAYEIVYEVLNAVTHGIGFLLALLAAVLMAFRANSHHVSTLTWVALSVYIVTVGLFLLASTLFHALIFTRAAKLFQFFDHAGIYFVILGSYTPYTWVVVGGVWGWSIWGAIVALTVAGLTYDLFFVGRWPWLSVIIYLVMGWLILIVMPFMWGLLPHTAYWLLLAGGIVYSLGTIFYLVPRIPMGHVYWHIFVLGGASLMYISIYLAI